MAETYGISLTLLKDKCNVIPETESRGEAYNIVYGPLEVIKGWWFPSDSTWTYSEALARARAEVFIMKLNEREFSIFKPETSWSISSWSWSTERGILFPSYIKPEAMGIAAGGVISAIGFSIAYISGNLLGALVLLGPIIASIIGLVSVFALARETS